MTEAVPARGLPVVLGPAGPEPVDLGRFGEFGGRFVPETLVPALIDLERDFREAWSDDAFRAEFAELLTSYAGRPTPVTECHRLSERLGVRVLLKREDLTHTGSHKINNVLGQALLTRRMGKRRVIAETGAGQHGVATATAAALFGLDCLVFMGAVDVERQALNVFRMKSLGADVVPVTSGSATLKDAINEALRDWVATVETTHYCIGSVVGPAPVPVDGAGVPTRRRRRGVRAVPRRSSAPTPISSSRASAAARTRSARSPASSTPRRGWSAWRRAVTGWSRVSTARR